MNNLHILTTSGFIIPNNNYYTVLTKDKIADTSIFNRTVLYSVNSGINKLIDTNQIYHSEVANKAYKKFEGSGSFEDFIFMVDIATDILSKIDYDEFFKLQANNPHISAFGIKMCEELLNGMFFKTYRQYAIFPFNLRFSINNGLTSERIEENLKIMRNSKKRSLATWQNLLSKLANDRSAFCTFFKYIFVDSY